MFLDDQTLNAAAVKWYVVETAVRDGIPKKYHDREYDVFVHYPHIFDVDRLRWYGEEKYRNPRKAMKRLFRAIEDHSPGASDIAENMRGMVRNALSESAGAEADALKTMDGHLRRIADYARNVSYGKDAYERIGLNHDDIIAYAVAVDTALERLSVSPPYLRDYAHLVKEFRKRYIVYAKNEDHEFSWIRRIIMFDLAGFMDRTYRYVRSRLVPIPDDVMNLLEDHFKTIDKVWKADTKDDAKRIYSILHDKMKRSGFRKVLEFDRIINPYGIGHNSRRAGVW